MPQKTLYAARTRKNNYLPLKDNSSDLPPGYSNSDGEHIPFACTRCFFRHPVIRVRHKKDNHMEYICHVCKSTDPILRNEYVKPRQLQTHELNAIIQSFPLPSLCDKCHIQVKQGELQGKINQQEGSVDFFCIRCR